MTESFAVNGRFLSQDTTGVQRYARNVVAALDASLAAAGQKATLIAPPGADVMALQAIDIVRSGRLSGHGWEQIELPRLWPGRLLNLCNTAPVMKGDQIVCIHDANIFTAPESYSCGFRTAYRALQPLLARRSARIATVSQASARQLARHLPLRAADIAVLPNGHEHALAWDPAKSERAQGLLAARADAERPFVLALGSRGRHKNLALLVKIAPQLAELGLDVVIAGGGGGIFAQERLPQAANVKLLGRVSDDDLAFLLERALCLAFPSWTEGFGLPILEAMARGCPVVSSDRASMPEVCGDAALLASPADPAAWVGHVRRLAESAALRQELSERGRGRLPLFSWRSTAEGYLDLAQSPKMRRAAPTLPATAAPRIAAVIATRGRPEVVTGTVLHLLAHQTLKPDSIIVSCIDPADAGGLQGRNDVVVLTGPAGLAAQRNTALAHLPRGTEIVAFFDDDFVAHEDWLATAAQTFRDEAGIDAFTGRVLADGATGPGISLAEAMRLVAAPPPSDWSWIEPYSPYGCNMAFRLASIGDLRFDERLVLYGWLEDRDFAAALARQGGGRLVKSADAIGVHMGVKGGRMAGERFGYSQIVNPLYMLRKGTMTLGQVADHLFRNMSSNLGRSLRPEPFIDRRGRLRGNLLGIADILRGRLQPERAAALQPRGKFR
ncbi:glycosyltransferase [Bosea psychrotolerans]|uniref:Glycosyl transferase family 2 n=1 Tax=Bosea psychrotolerans TaxID=1871628 RepID=A0A2S4MCS8_9HYPH|nr:glycosyltransferase [Bosea psychrotolerans]POR52524.1 glycosyl transferase family 2 [Bosea psychrotolerans]